jgi:hypothetical protein
MGKLVLCVGTRSSKNMAVVTAGCSYLNVFIYLFNRNWVDTRWQQYSTLSVDTRWQQYSTHTAHIRLTPGSSTHLHIKIHRMTKIHVRYKF